jgi:hypothetical protein
MAKVPPDNELKRKRFASIIKIIGEIGAVALLIRDKPKTLDWISLSLRGLGLSMSIAEEHKKFSFRHPYNFFSGNVEWMDVPASMKVILPKIVSGVYRDPIFYNGLDMYPSWIMHGFVGEEEIAWTGDEKRVTEGPFMMLHRKKQTIDSVGKILWAQAGSDHVSYNSGELTPDPVLSNNIHVTVQMMTLWHRVKSFIDAGHNRSYLLEGPPGTGKTSLIDWLVSELTLKSLRVSLGDLHLRTEGTSVSLGTWMDAMKPDVIIIDDIDRISDFSAAMLKFLENANKQCKIVIGTANSLKPIAGAPIRPGRFDDIIRIDRLDPLVIRKMMAPDYDLIPKLEHLPAAYIVDFVKRRQVIGSIEAELELDSLIERATKTGEVKVKEN